jgi:hypothetical protein
VIILAELTERRTDDWTWVDTAAPGRQGTLPAGATPATARPGARVPLEVEWRRATWRVQRVVDGPPCPAERRPAANLAVPPGDSVASRCSGASRSAGASHGAARRRGWRAEVGDLVIAPVPFTNWPGARDRGRLHKARPCVVVAAEPDELTVRAVYGSNSAVRREGLGRRIRDWREAGLRKPSYVAGASHFVSPAATSGAIGRLTRRDLARLLD